MESCMQTLTSEKLVPLLDTSTSITNHNQWGSTTSALLNMITKRQELVDKNLKGSAQ